MCNPWPNVLNITVTDADLNQNPLVVEPITRGVTMYKFGSEEIETVNIIESNLDSFIFTASLPMLKTGAPDCGCGSCAPCINPACCAQAQDGTMYATEGDVLQAVYKDASPIGYRIWTQRAGSVGSLVFQTVSVSGSKTSCSCSCDGVGLCSCSAPMIVGTDFILLLTDADIPASQPPTVSIKSVRAEGIGSAADLETLALISTGQLGQFTGIIKSVSSNIGVTQYNGIINLCDLQS
jgi:hypothetical protein